ncbi:MAG: nucleotidyltransferase family protein [Dethiosulfatibacter sp.]|nr:nucleotidyltransferase family protein [Dethiosulfatibacter sp.]
MISGIVLASGFSSRFGSDKLMSNFNGKEVIRWVIDSCISSRLDEIIVVYRTPELSDLLKDYPVKMVENKTAHSGMSASVRLGVSSLSNQSIGCLILMGDQPLFGKNDINIMIDRFKRDRFLVVASHNGKRKNPVIFPRSYYKRLLSSTGDKGGRDIIDSDSDKILIEFDYEKLLDIDTKYDLEQLIGDKEEQFDV